MVKDNEIVDRSSKSSAGKFTTITFGPNNSSTGSSLVGAASVTPTTATTSGKSNTTSNEQHYSTSPRSFHRSPDSRKKTMKKGLQLPKLPFQLWTGQDEFLKTQLQMAAVILIAWIGNNWEPSYDRNKNHNMFLFWFMNFLLFLAAMISMKHDPNASARGVQLLSRAQTEEWKGWMQWAFIMYHYYRAYSVYNVIRVFVSAYVWMTGFGNFLYFDKKQDFSIERAISMWLRINYFPLLLSFCLNISLENYYVVPLHTTGFFITMATCYLASVLRTHGGKRFEDYWVRNGVAIAVCLLVHIVFYETSLVESLRFFSNEYHFRFTSDKYTAFVGILSGYVWTKFKSYMQWCYADEDTINNDAAPLLDGGAPAGGDEEQQQQEQPQQSYQQPTPTEFMGKVQLEIARIKTSPRIRAKWIQRVVGVFLIWFWWAMFGHIQDKYTYNPIHPYCFWLPVAGWLMVRNSSKYLTEIHSTVLEFFGKITLETYVLQFHVFMNHNVKNIPMVIPGSDVDGNGFVKFLNFLFCGVGFVALAYLARKLTVTTQTTATDLMAELRKKRSNANSSSSNTTTTTTSNTTVVSDKVVKPHDSALMDEDENNNSAENEK